jgi:predicted unusual protein kinase regulating ubiquinone biosynthesis (AarF/ABC1/UbiB family)
VQAVQEIRESVPKEFDFCREARLMGTISSRLRAAGHTGVVVPQVLADLSSSRLLVMQHMPGGRCADRLTGA